MDITKMSTEQIAAYLREDRKTAFVLWQVADVLDRAGDLGIKLEMEEAEQIINTIERAKDCEYGITWDTLDTAITDFDMDEKEENKTFDIVFHDIACSDRKGFTVTKEEAIGYIKMHNGTDHSYFEDYKGGLVQVVCNESGAVVYETEIE